MERHIIAYSMAVSPSCCATPFLVLGLANKKSELLKKAKYKDYIAPSEMTLSGPLCTTCLSNRHSTLAEASSYAH